jgi:hypothetical protein
MSDPEFLAERRRVREELQILTERYRKLNQEFDRRAHAAWLGSSSEQPARADQPAHFDGATARDRGAPR